MALGQVFQQNQTQKTPGINNAGNLFGSLGNMFGGGGGGGGGSTGSLMGSVGGLMGGGGQYGDLLGFLRQGNQSGSQSQGNQNTPSNPWLLSGSNGGSSGQSTGYHQWDDFVSQYMPWLKNQANYAQGLEPQRQQIINAFMQQMNPGNRQALVDRIRNQGMVAAKDQAPALAATLGSQGISGGTLQGATLSAQNQANQNANNFSAQLNSPEGIMQMLQGLLGGIGMGQNLTALSPLGFAQQLGQQGLNAERGYNLQQQQLDAQNSGGLFGGLGGLLGLIPGMGGLGALGSLFGGGGSGNALSGQNLAFHMQ